MLESLKAQGPRSLYIIMFFKLMEMCFFAIADDRIAKTPSEGPELSSYLVEM